MTAPKLSIHGRLTELADATRCRLLLALEAHELTVGELCTALALPQSTVSRHLRTLSDEGWVQVRAEGTSRRYRLAQEALETPSRRLWQVVREQTAELPAAAEDRERLRAVLGERRSRSQAFFASAAGRWDRLRDDLLGKRADAFALLGLLEPDLVVGDLGCGTGRVSEVLASYVAQVIAVDESGPMLAAARRRLAGQANVEVRSGDIAALPIDDAALDAAVMVLLLAVLDDPMPALHEARRVLKPGGRLLVADFRPHGREELRADFGHARLGTTESELAAWLGDAGFADIRIRPLASDPDAKGPALHIAGARVATRTRATPSPRGHAA
jgi:ArsR family transcriptional regulator